MPVFSDELLSCLPDRVQAKIRRLESSPPDDSTAALLRRAAFYLDAHGAWLRYVKHGVRPAHVVPAERVPDGGYSKAVQGIRDRIEALASQMAEVDRAYAAGELTEAWRDVHATDIGLARLALERVEESVVCAADATIARRPDIDPAAFLEIERV